MNPFDSIERCSYSLRVEYLAGAYYVDARKLLDILENRAMLSIRKSGTPGVEERMADSERGRFAELHELYKAIKIHVDK